MESISKPKDLVGKQRTKRKKEKNKLSGFMQTSPHGLCACANVCEGDAFWVVVGTRTMKG